MEIIFIGSVYNPNKIAEVETNSKHMLHYAADVHQWAIIKGLIMNKNVNIKLINSIHIGSFPHKYNKLFIQSYNWKFKGIEAYEIGFINIFGIKNIIKSCKIYKILNKIIGKNKNKEIYLISYSLYMPFIKPIYKLINKNKNIKWISIIPEIPYFYIGKKDKSFIYNILKKKEWNKIYKINKKAKGYYLLTNEMKDFLNIEGPSITIEGILNTTDNYNNISSKKTNNEIIKIAYTGTTDIEFGLLDLLKAFSYIKNVNFRLIICGNGNGDNILKDTASIDKRIVWKGYLPRNEVLIIQKNATLLINPRRPDEEFTKYSFPSKTMEYMASGTPSIMHKLPGIPHEYYQFLYFFDNTNPIDMAKQIESICLDKYEESINLGKTAKAFIISNKNIKKQGDKFLNFLSNI